MPVTRPPAIAGAIIGLLLALAFAEPALAQAKNPFSVGISEGGGSATGLTGWILAQQGWFEHQLSLAVRGIRLGTGAVWPLVTLSFVYGVFHAAGPGHGKAVIASYMVANERALKRGILLSFAAACLQGVVAILLIALLTLVLRTTAAHVKDVASWVETASFAAVVALGLHLVWRKGRALAVVWGRQPAMASGRSASLPLLFSPIISRLEAPGVGALFPAQPIGVSSGRFACTAAEVDHPVDCAHCLALDPQLLGSERFDIRQAATTVLAAGLRPCSGAILVLVFAISQGVFGAGVLSVLAMSIGVALTTAGLATGTVFFKTLVTRAALRASSSRAALFGAAIEFAAACAVLVFGALLLAGYAVSAGA